MEPATTPIPSGTRPSPLHNPDGIPEEIVTLDDRASGLSGYIVIHSTRLGPAAGGCRLWRYESREEACHDALRLAEGMAFKNALAGLPLGGGKAVLMCPLGEYDRIALMRAFGQAVRRLDGRYITAEDVGTSPDDMRHVAERTRFVAGLERHRDGPGGDPSPWTAKGIFDAMRAAVRHKLNRNLDGVVVAVQGLGNVGFALCRLLHGEGASLVASDIRAENTRRAADEFGARILPVGKIAGARADVFAPCALGGVLTTRTVRNMRAGIVCGGANNQLASTDVAQDLANAGILYAPDYLVNAGGIINVAAEFLGWTQEEVERRIAAIGGRLLEVVDEAARRNITTAQAADERAREIIRIGRSGTAETGPFAS